MKLYWKLCWRKYEVCRIQIFFFKVLLYYNFFVNVKRYIIIYLILFKLINSRVFLFDLQIINLWQNIDFYFFFYQGRDIFIIVGVDDIMVQLEES